MRRAMVILTALCVFATASPAQGQEQKVCDTKIAAKGKKWAFQGSGVGCRFMEKWTKAFLREREQPPGYKCTRVRKQGVCDARRGKDVFIFYVAPRKRG